MTNIFILNLSFKTKIIFYSDRFSDEHYYFTLWSSYESFNASHHNFFLITKSPLLFSNSLSSNNVFLSTTKFANNHNILENKNHFIMDEDYYNKKFVQENDINFQNFLFFKKPSFITFFINNMVDVPVCFKKSYSLKRKSFELPLLKFCNLLMKEGKKEKIFKILFLSFRKQDELKIKEVFPYNESNLWFKNYLLLNNSLFLDNLNKFFFFSPENEESVDFVNNLLTTPNTVINGDVFIKNHIINFFFSINPVFGYFIFSVDKNIKKFSRGKSGKYVFIWKYIAPYKRHHLTMKWIVKEIKFANEKTFTKRINKTFLTLDKNIDSSFAWKSKIFSHNYVFRNFKKTLMSNFKTTT